MPQASVLKAWAEQVPADFRFVLKAPQVITHFKRLNNVGELTDQFLQTASVLKKRCGPLLFQLPPNFKKDLPRLEGFLKLVTKRSPSAFEFRHPSWFDAEVFDCLRGNSCALCFNDTTEAPGDELIRTAPFGYVRLRRERYTDAMLRKWIAKLKSQKWKETYVFFKHEDVGTGPKLAARMLKLIGG